MLGKVKKCPVCGTEKYFKPSELKRNRRFCSRTCSGIFSKGKPKKKFTKETKLKMSIAKTGKKGKESSHWKGGKPNCKICGKLLTNYNAMHCKKCRGQINSERNHYRWIKDRTLVKRREQRSNAEYKQWRLKVWKRDSFKCKMSSVECQGRLEAHHILNWKEHPKLRYKINNGITLCQAHHPRKRAEEKRLESLFVKLVSVSKKST